MISNDMSSIFHASNAFLTQAGWKLWPFAHLITYGVIPVEQRLLWVDCVELIWVTILSTYVSIWIYPEYLFIRICLLSSLYIHEMDHIQPVRESFIDSTKRAIWFQLALQKILSFSIAFH